MQLTRDLFAIAKFLFIIVTLQTDTYSRGDYVLGWGILSGGIMSGDNVRFPITLPTVHYEILGLVSKGIYTVHNSIASIKSAIMVLLCQPS